MEDAKTRELNLKVACLNAQIEGLFRQCYTAATQSILAPHYAIYGEMVRQIDELFGQIVDAMQEYNYQTKRIAEESNVESH